MKLGQTFETAQLPESDGGEFLAIPAGWYNVTIADAKLKGTKSGTGEYISLRLDITGPSHEGRVLFTNLNIRNQSSIAEKIGLQQLGEVLRAVGIARLSDTDQLICGSMQVKVKVKDDAEYGDANGKRNDVAAFKAVAGAASRAPINTASVPTPAPAGNKPPWAS